MDELKGKVAVITGGASGIGEATARLYVAEGARVIIADMQPERGVALAQALGDAARFIEVEVRQEDQVQAAVDLAMSEWGQLDCIFNNAGFGGVLGPIEQIPVDEFDMTMEVLVRGVFLGMKHATPVMKAAGGGSIINTASIAGLVAGRGPHVYACAKAAVIQLSKCVAMELGAGGEAGELDGHAKVRLAQRVWVNPSSPLPTGTLLYSARRATPKEVLAAGREVLADWVA